MNIGKIIEIVEIPLPDDTIPDTIPDTLPEPPVREPVPA